MTPSPSANPSPRLRCCVVEDDAPLREMLAGYLGQHGLQVRAVATGEELLAGLAEDSPDLVVMDIGLSGMSGLAVLARLRQAGSRVPVLLLSGHADEIDRIVGLEMGADDYQVKPFSARELLARIRALLRRADVPPPAVSAPTVFQIGSFRFEPATRQLHCGDDARTLSGVEHGLLSELCACAGQPVSRERLRDVAHGGSGAATLRAVDAGIVRLRRLVEPDPAEPRYIQTVRGQGYMFVPQSERAFV